MLMSGIYGFRRDLSAYYRSFGIIVRKWPSGALRLDFRDARMSGLVAFDRVLAGRLL
jgi:hypothetical protein